MKKSPEPSTTILKWLRENLGANCTAGLTGTDARALKASVHIVDLMSSSGMAGLSSAWRDVVGHMQPSTRHLAFHAVAHVMDWSHRFDLWNRAFPEPPPASRCKWEPGGPVRPAAFATSDEEAGYAVKSVNTAQGLVVSARPVTRPVDRLVLPGRPPVIEGRSL